MPGTPHGLYARVCRPGGEGRFRVAVINHGSPVVGADPRSMQPAACDSEPAAWLLAHDFLVVFPMRRGFGRTGGPMVESSGSCEHPDYVAAGLAGAADIAAAIAYATALPDAWDRHAVVIGQSIGGWATIAYDSVAHPRVDTLIVMAGGRGGWAHGVPGAICRPALLEAAARRFGATATTPMLWIYARNDSYFPPSVARDLARAFQAGGGALTLVQPAAFGTEGHFLFYGRGGSEIWGPPVERVLDGSEQGAGDE